MPGFSLFLIASEPLETSQGEQLRSEAIAYKGDHQAETF
jgi:hypothetical protein